MAHADVKIGVGLNIDKTGLNELKTALQAIQQEAAKASGSDKMTKELKESAKAAQQLEKILDSAWNSKLQQFNLNKVNNEIKTAYGGVNNLKVALEKSGNVGASAYNKVASSLLTTNMQLKQSNKLLDSMAVSMANTVKWGITSSIFNNMTQSIQKAWSYSKNLNTSLNDIRIVTGESAEKMDEFAEKANKAAKGLGKSTLDYTNAALIYYQQGLSEEEVAARAETTLKAANVTGQSGEAVSEQLTAVWNGYKVSAEEAELYIDKLAAVAATTAADLEELSTGMSKVASAADLMGVDIDQLNAQMATIVSVTRQAPESVGTALKTIYARMGDIEAGLDSETSLGHYTEEMKAMGVNVLDANGKLRDMGAVIEEIGGNWKNMTREQQISLSQTMAGTRQYNNLLSLFDNWDMYTEALNTSANAAGALQKQQDIYMESTAAHLQQLRTETQRTYDLMFNPDTVNGMIDAFDGGLEFFNNFIEGIDGGGHALLLLGSIAANVFDKQIAGSLLRVQNNLQVLKLQIQDTFKKTNTKEKWINTQAASQVNMNNIMSGVNVGQEGLKAQQKAASEILKVQRGLTQEQYQQSLEINKQIGLETQRLAQLHQEEDIGDEIKNGLALMNASESMSNSAIEVRVNNKKEALAILEREKRALIELKFLEAEVANNQKTGTEAVKEALMYEEQYKAILGTIKTEDTQIDASWERVLNSIKEGTFSVNQFKNIIDQIEREELEINAAIKAGNDLLRARSPQLQREKEEAQRRKQAYEGENSKIVAQGETNMKMQKFVNIGMAAVGVISSLTGAMSVLGDETAGTEQKVHAVGSAFSGVSMAIGSAFGPTGMVIGGIIGALGSLVSQLDFVEDAFKSTEERMEEFKAQQKELISDAEQFRSAKKSLSEVAEEYENLAEKADADNYDSNIDDLTEEERARYNELKGIIAEYNEDAVIAHNAEGEAILAKNAGIQETIDLLKEQYELEAGQKISENWAEQNETKEKELQEATEGQQKAQAKVDEYNSPGGKANLESTSKMMIDDAYNQIVSMTGYLEDEEGKIQQAFADLTTAYTDGQLTEADVDNYLDTIKEASDTNTSSLQKAAKRLRDGITYTQDEVDKANDELATANIELERTQHVDVSHILNAIKYVEGYNEGYDKLGDLEIETVDTDALITDFIESLEFGKGNDGETYEELTQKVSDYVDNLYEGLSQLENPDEIFSKAQEIEPANFNSVKEYNQGVLDKINEIINSNKEQFDAMGVEQKKALFEALFGVEGLEFNEENLADKVNTGYKEKRENLVPTIQNDFDYEGLKEVSKEDLINLSPESIDNFKELEGYIDLAKVSTEGWAAALEDAQDKMTEVNEKAKLLSEIESDGTELGFDEDQIEATKNLTEDLLELSKAGEEVNEFLQDYPNLAKEMAKEDTRIKKGIEDLTDSWEEYSKALKNGIADSNYSKALEGLKGNLEDILDLSQEEAGWLTDDFIVDNMDDIKAAAEGDMDAIDRLRLIAAESFAQMEADSMINVDIEPPSQEELNEMNALMESIMNEDIEIGASIDDSQYASQLLKMMNNAQYSAQSIADVFNEIGWEPEIEYRTMTLSDKDISQGYVEVPKYTETVEGADSVPTQKIPITSEMAASGSITYPVIKGSASSPVMARKPAASTSAKGSSPKSSGKKGGGGGGGSKKQKEDHVKTEKDRYHDVNVRLKQIDKELEDIGKDQEKYFGKDLIKALNKELDILEKQKKVYKDKLNIAKQEQKELQKSLKSDGVKFNSDGTISNYEKALQAQENALNKLIDKYNKLPAKKQEKFKETVLDPAKEEFEQFKENIERYDEVLLDEIPEIEDNLKKTLDREIEINVQKLKMEVELRLDLSEAQKDWNEFQREVLDGIDSDDILGNAQADKNLYETLLSNGTLGAETNKIGNIAKAINDINTKGTSDIYGDNKQLAMEDLKAAMDELMGSMTDLNDLKKNIDEAYLDMIDEMGEAFDNQAESLEYVNELLEHNINLTELLHGEDAYAEMAHHYEDIVANNLKIIAANQEAAAFYKNKMQTETDPEAAKKWKELWKDAIADLNASVEDSIQTINDQYMNSIDLAFEKMKAKFAGDEGKIGDKSFGYYSLEWELANEEAEKYLGAMDKAYELQKLQNKYKKSIDETSSVKAQRELNKLMDEEMKKLREKDKLTQYDIDRANAKYELRLKEIALEEAQQNKSQMRLRRDSSGNYSYQFIADEQAVADAQQEVADATHSLFEMDQDEMNQKGQEYLDTLREWNERLKEVDIDDHEARALINKEYQERLSNLKEDYLAIEQNLIESAFMDRALLYDEDLATYQAMADAEREILMNQMVPTWDTGVRQMMNTMAGPEGLGPACEKVLEDLNTATDAYNESLAAIETTAKTTFDYTKEQYDANVLAAKDLVTEAQNLVTETEKELTAVTNLKTEVDNLATSYATVFKNATDALTAAQALWEAEEKKAAEEAKKNNPEPGKNPEKDPPKNPEKDPPKTPDPEPVKDGGEPKVGKKVTYESGKYYYTSAGDSPTGTKKRGKKVYITKIKKGAKYPIHISTGSSLGSGDLGWLKEKQLKFDTGGYTGDWAGNDGKTAILHKKELVLNAKDTENILATVNIVRDMQTMINSLNDSIISRTSGMMNSIGSNLDLNTTVGTDLNQQVSIQASFPGVSSRAEIEQAFENLVNMASQHAYNTRR